MFLNLDGLQLQQQMECIRKPVNQGMFLSRHVEAQKLKRGLLDVGNVTGWNALHLAVAGKHQNAWGPQGILKVWWIQFWRIARIFPQWVPDPLVIMKVILSLFHSCLFMYLLLEHMLEGFLSHAAFSTD